MAALLRYRRFREVKLSLQIPDPAGEKTPRQRLEAVSAQVLNGNLLWYT
jgi:hypothetical protein